MFPFLPSRLSPTPKIQAHPAISQHADAEAKANLVGALLFFTYIIAALFFSVYILLSINRIGTTAQQNDQTTNGTGSHQSRRTRNTNEHSMRLGTPSILATLAMASFSVLSWNMLNFLIVSYARWAIEHDLQPAFKIGNSEQFWLQLKHIWAWSLDSNLFQTFAEDLTTDPIKWKLVQAALIYSYTWNLYMSALGYKYDIPDLWAYFVLDQILPVSFTQHLFCVALSRIVQHHPARASIEAETNVRPKTDGEIGLGLRILSFSCYCIGLYCMPATISTRWFLPTLFALRILLFTPFILDRLTFKSRNNDTTSRITKMSNFNKCLLIGSISLGMITLPLTNNADLTLKDDNYAVAALSSDMIIGVLGGVVLFCQGTKRGFQTFV